MENEKEIISPAPRQAAAGAVRKLLKRRALATRSQDRLKTLLNLVDDGGYINYLDAYECLFPEVVSDPEKKNKADGAFSKFRRTLESSAKEYGIVLRLEVDQNKVAEYSRRRFWFECEDDYESRLTPINRSGIQGIPPYLQEQTLRIREGELSYLLVYAEKDRDKALELNGLLQERFVSRNLTWKALDYHDVIVGNKSLEERKAYAEQSTFVLLLVNTRLLAVADEVGEVIEGLEKVPLMLQKTDRESLDRGFLGGVEIFTDRENKSWIERVHKKDDWADQAVGVIIEKILRVQRGLDTDDCLERISYMTKTDIHRDDYQYQFFDKNQEKGLKALPQLKTWLKDKKGSPFCAIFGELGMGKTTLCQCLTLDLLETQQDDLELPFPVYLDLRNINTLPGWKWEHGVPELDVMLAHLLRTTYNVAEGEVIPGVDDIKRLAQQRGGLIIFDGLDEVMNRLTPDHCIQFIHQLWSVMPPVVWKDWGGDRVMINPESSNQGEKTDSSSRQKIERQYGRIIMTCRSHFFKTITDQLSAFIGQDREVVKEKDYFWVTLLPFNGEQVASYFHQVFAGQEGRAERVIEMLDEIHDLGELASRPYNLKLIQDQVDYLEGLYKSGEPVRVSHLYEGLVDAWLLRDGPKHQLKREHKLVLMEKLAHWLWSKQRREIDYVELEDWLMDELIANPRWQFNYQEYTSQRQGMDILQEDLRNASFLVRQGDRNFRFAHTSIMEFFLARSLYRALIEDSQRQGQSQRESERESQREDERESKNVSPWEIDVPSQETLEFLRELINQGETEVCLESIASMGRTYRRKLSELLLRYLMHAAEKGETTVALEGLDLSGADIRELKFAGRDNKINWRRGGFGKADLRGGDFRGVDFSGSCFDGAVLDNCVFDDCILNGIQGQAISLIGTVFHNCVAESVDFSLPILYHSEWLGKSGLPTLPPLSPIQSPFDNRPFTRPSTRIQLIDDGQVNRANTDIHIDTDNPSLPNLFVSQSEMPPEHATRSTFTGHSGAVRSVCYSPDGRQLASAGSDRSIRLWDAQSGKPLHTLTGHNSGAVRSVCYSPDGRQLASAGDDHSVRLWEKGEDEYEARRQFELLPRGNCVVWRRPDDVDRYWEFYSEDAWRWLGWKALSPNGSEIIRYPMSYFVDASC